MMTQKQINDLYDGIYGPSTSYVDTMGRMTPDGVNRFYQGIAPAAAPPSRMDPVGGGPSYSFLTDMFAPSPAATGKDETRLTSPAYSLNAGELGFSPAQVNAIGNALGTTTNPQGQRIVTPGQPTLTNGRIAPTPRPATDGLLARTFAGLPAGAMPVAQAAPSLGAAPALGGAAPLRVVVSGARMLSPTAPTPAVKSPAMTALTKTQTLQNMGLSSAAAYEALNAGNTSAQDRLLSRATGRGTRDSGDGGRQPTGSIW